MPFPDLPDDDGIAAGADHDADSDEKADDRVIEIDGGNGHLADKTFNKQTVNHLIDGNKDKGKNAGGDKLSKRGESKVLAEFLFHHLFLEKMPWTVRKKDLRSLTFSRISRTVTSDWELWVTSA